MSAGQHDDKQTIEAGFALAQLKQRTQLYEIASHVSLRWGRILALNGIFILFIIGIYVLVGRDDQDYQMFLLISGVTVILLSFIKESLRATNRRIDALLKLLQDTHVLDVHQQGKNS